MGAARKARGLTQIELAERLGASRGAIQAIESDKPHVRVTQTMRRAAREIGWAEGSIEAVLAGGDPIPVEPEEPTSTSPPAAFAEGLPLRIAQELSEGQVLDTEVLSLGGPGGATVVVVVKRGASTASPEQIRKDLDDWSRVERKLRRIVSDDEETDTK
jgi:transcriptional regulator with XRE-family HTH domain